MRGKLLGTAAALSGSLLWVGLAQAAPTDTMSVGVQIDGTFGDTASITTGATSTSGSISTTGTDGAYRWHASIDAFPILPEPQLNTATLNTSSTQSGLHHFRVYITLQGITSATAPPIQDFLSGFTTNFETGAVTDVKGYTFLDPGNGLYKLTTQLGTADMPGPSSTTQSASTSDLISSLTAPYSVTEVIDITFNGTCTTLAGGGASCSDNTSIDLAAVSVPEPASLGLLGSALVGLGWFGRRRRKAA